MQKLRKYLIILLIIISISFILFNSKKEYLSEENILGVYVNNELSDNYPSKGSALFQKAVCDDSSTKVTWDNDKWGLLISNLNKKVKCNLYFYSGQTVFDFDYTGTEQTFVAPVSGTYKLETWGAQGGNYSNENHGGYGGYSVGIIYLKINSGIYINIGGLGDSEKEKLTDYTDFKIGHGGYNGGGNSYNYYDTNNYIANCCSSAGGGATHIASKSGVLHLLENFKDNILIVSGGGGGALNYNNSFYYATGGAGGGYIGGYSIGKLMNSSPLPGTQNSGSNFGNSITTEGYWNISGGGGGYYGGFSLDASGGSGGSGYIGNSLLKDKVMYCYNCEESNEESTKTISTTCSEETPTSDCAKKGNGYARITLVSIDE